MYLSVHVGMTYRFALQMPALPPPPPCAVGVHPNYGIIPGRLVLEVWQRPHQGLSISHTTEKSYRAALPQPQIP